MREFHVWSPEIDEHDIINAFTAKQAAEHYIFRRQKCRACNNSWEVLVDNEPFTVKLQWRPVVTAERPPKIEIKKEEDDSIEKALQRLTENIEWDGK